MSTEDTKYTITEAATISGLPESTLRYYETIGIIRPIARDPNTKRRVYSEEDINLVVAIACLNATGLSIEDMKAYLENTQHGEAGAQAQVKLLGGQLKHLVAEMQYAELRIAYVKAKVTYWQSVIRRDDEAIEVSRRATYAAADKMKLPKNTARRK